MQCAKLFLAVLVGLLINSLSAPTFALIPRPAGVIGQVVAANGDEEIWFFDAPSWQLVEIKQDLVPGDVLRTGRYGQLAILYRDQTQVRVHHDSILEIEEIGVSGSSRLRLAVGAMWVRAPRVPKGLQIETPSATAAIRGTDWALAVAPDGSSTLTVLRGTVEFFNDFGRVTVGRDETATARIGQPPVKRFIIDIKDQPKWALYLDLEWIDMLSITGERLAALRAERDRLDIAAIEATGDSHALLRAAEVAYDLGDVGAAERLLATFWRSAQPEDLGRAWLLEGMIDVHRRRYAEAEERLSWAAETLAGRSVMIAWLGHMAVAVENKQFLRAQQIADDTERAFPDAPETAIAQAWLTSFSGAHEQAITKLEAAAARHPDDARLLFMIGHLAQLTGDKARAPAALTAAIERDDGFYFAWDWLGNYYHLEAPNAANARFAYRKALAINPRYWGSLNNLGLLDLSEGNYTAAEANLRSAIEAAPDLSLPKASYALFLSSVNRTREAEMIVRDALERDPSDAMLLMARGLLDLQFGKDEEAIEWLQKAIVVDPALPGTNTLLAIADYQAGRVDDAMHMLSLASRLDPNDPVPLLVGSVIAQDRAEAGKAVEFAQQAFNKYQASTPLYVEGLGSTRSGLFNLGSAYGMLGLNEWGAYYGDLSSSPYLANSYFFLANTYPSDVARDGAITQGLLLDPTAVSAPTRYYEFIREPRIDPTVGGNVGDQDGGLTGSAFASVQGLSRFGSAFAYNVEARRLEDTGFRKNADITRTHLFGDFGYQPDEANSFLMRTLFEKSDSGVPGPTPMAQKDDTRHDLLASASLGYQHRFDFDNRVISQITYLHNNSEYHNGNPFGIDLSNLDLSLVDWYADGVLSAGYAKTRNLHLYGLYDLGGTAQNPYVIAGPIDATLFRENYPNIGKKYPNTIPAKTDFNITSDDKQRNDSVLIQFRHLFDWQKLSLTYGGEWMPIFDDVTTNTVRGNAIGQATLYDSGAGVVHPSPLTIPYGSPQIRGQHNDSDRQVGQGYAQAAWHITPAVTAEAGGFFSHYENGIDTSSSYVDPRVGVSWLVTPYQWLRIAYQQSQNLGLISGTLAPVSTVGLVVPDPFLTMGLAMRPGSRSSDLALRWDAQWTNYLFTFLQLEHQTFDNTQIYLPWSLADLALPRGERNAFSAGTNVWFLEQFGAFGSLMVEDSEAHVHGASSSDPDMPLLPSYIGRIGLTWVDPLQISATLSQRFVGERASDINPHDDLGSYQSTDFVVSWQPFEKHVLTSLSLLNILDNNYKLAAGFPSPGRTLLLGLNYRF